MVKNSAPQGRRHKRKVLIPGSGRSLGNPLQYPGLENPTDRGAWRAAVHGVTESDTTEAT